jgi:hypothetical protein
VKPKNAQRDLVCWCGIWNFESRIIQTNELADPSLDREKGSNTDKKHGREDDSSVGSNKDCNTNQKKKSSFRRTKNKKGQRIKILRRTRTAKTGIPETSVTISMQDSEDSFDGDGNDDDDCTSGQDEESTKVKNQTRKKKKEKEILPQPYLLTWTHRD